jgi:hypothetical protein
VSRCHEVRGGRQRFTVNVATDGVGICHGNNNLRGSPGAISSGPQRSISSEFPGPRPEAPFAACSEANPYPTDLTDYSVVAFVDDDSKWSEWSRQAGCSQSPRRVQDYGIAWRALQHRGGPVFRRQRLATPGMAHGDAASCNPCLSFGWRVGNPIVAARRAGADPSFCECGTSGRRSFIQSVNDLASLRPPSKPRLITLP